MSIHVETHTVTAGSHVAEVLVTATRRVIHCTRRCPSQSAARQEAMEWIGRQVLAATAQAATPEGET